MFDRVVASKLTSSAASWLSGEATDAMFSKGGAGARYRFIHDWREIKSYDTDARLKLIDWGRRLARNIARIDVILPPDAPALVRMAVSGGTMTLTMLGIPCFVRATIEEALSGIDIRPARTA